MTGITITVLTLIASIAFGVWCFNENNESGLIAAGLITLLAIATLL